jgi:Zn finger protein HypA/HybF involved in hydrogenase expression
MLKCEDCGLPYTEFALDTTIPNSEWDAIDGNGVLCANCIVKRASLLPGIIAARMTFEFAPLKAVEHSVRRTCSNCGGTEFGTNDGQYLCYECGTPASR